MHELLANHKLNCITSHFVVWSSKISLKSNSVLIFLINCMHHVYSYILQKTPLKLKLVNWFQRYEPLKDAKNSRKQKTFSALFGSILKSIFPTSDWFCLITSHLHFKICLLGYDSNMFKVIKSYDTFLFCLFVCFVFVFVCFLHQY